MTEKAKNKAPEVVPLKRGTPPLTGRQVAAVPGADVALLALDLPQGLRGQNREDVARRQLRDIFGLNPNTVDIRPFHAAGQTAAWRQLLVADAGLVDTWRNGPAADARAVLPDYLTLPTASGLWAVAPGAAPDSVAVRLGLEDGFGTQADLAPVLFERALQAAGDNGPRALLRLGAPLPEVEAVAAAHGVEVVTEDAAAQTLAAGELTFDLRKDPQLARARLAGRVLPWRWPVLLGLVAAAIWSAAQIVVTERITEETQMLRAQTIALVQQDFTQGGPVLDVRMQVSQALAAAQGQAAGWGSRPDPLGLFGRAAVALAAVGARTQAARYSTAEGLQVVAELDDFAAVETLVAQLKDAGLAVELIETATRSAGVRATLALAPAAQAAAE